ncbi:di-trans,poly-cis-decaprenylcistransferase [Patescibacteria group bacterium]|nr:di-trans,poly-cis-decaprenylcistransferase [Patescibacteria group bacterium]
MDSVIPACIGVIMDGNRRWARAHERRSFEGHTEGYARFKDFLGWAKTAGVTHVVAYAFSTENWKRGEDEVGHLLKLFQTFLIHDAEKICSDLENPVRVRFIGDRTRFSLDTQVLMESLEHRTAHVEVRTVNIAVSYGGRLEILEAIKKMKDEKEVTEETFASHLWTAGIPDPDLIIRTGGEMRLSNFLPWQSVYSELFFTKTEWPAFTEKEFLEILESYSARKRNFGI